MKSLIFLLLATLSFAAVDLSKVDVINRKSPLTHARVLSVTVRGITFACDQGIVQVPFDLLPPEFKDYRNQAKPDVAPSAPSVVAAPKPIVKVAPLKEKTALQLAREAKERAQKVSHYKTIIAQSEALISKYDRQTLIGNPHPVSTEDYNLAKALLEEAKVKISELTQ